MPEINNVLDHNEITRIKNQLEFFFIEYFGNKGIIPDSEYFNKLPNSTKNHAIKYAIDKTLPNVYLRQLQFGSIADYIQVNDFVALTEFFIYKCSEYNIIGFMSNYCYCLGVEEVTLYDIVNGNDIVNRDSVEVNNIYVNNIKRVMNLSKSGILNKLSDDRTGVVVLANNEKTVGLEYAQKRTIEQVAINNLQVAQLPTFGNKLLE